MRLSSVLNLISVVVFAAALGVSARHTLAHWDVTPQQRQQQQLALPLRHVVPAAGRLSHVVVPRQLAETLTCPEGCLAGSCVKTAAGTVRCTACMDTLVLNKTSGECACPMGRYAANPGSCIDCDKGFFCPGGVYRAKQLPSRVQCPTDMTTLGRRSTTVRSCVNLPGFSYVINLTSGVAAASLCPADTYGPGLKKQRACVPCPSYMTTAGRIGATSPSACIDKVCVGNPCANVTSSSRTCTSRGPIPGGTFDCGCYSGLSFNMVSRTCEDTDGCIGNSCSHVANATGECVDVPAPGTGYKCVCRPFFTWNSTNLTCTPNSACAADPCASVANFNGTCSTVAGGGLGYNCSCAAGFAWNSTSGTCAVVNPCHSQPCAKLPDSYGTCTPTADWSSFSCSCRVGLRWDSSAQVCTGCPPGLRGPDCSPCPAGTYQPGNSTICRPCPAGTAAPVGSAACIDTSVAVGKDHVCAIVAPDLKPLCGRFNGSSEAIAPLELTNVTSMCAGDSHTCAVSNGRVSCWGSNEYNQSVVPRDISDAVVVRCASTFTCVMTALRNVTCFGSIVPSELLGNVGQLTVGLSNICYTLLQNHTHGHMGRVGCFGSLNASAGLPSNVTADLVAAFQHATCIVSSDGILSCFGDTNSLGSTPTAVEAVADVVGGEGFAVARLNSGLLASWGGAASSLNLPTGLNATSVAAANQTLCVRASDGGVLCFGAWRDYLLETFSVSSGLQNSAAAADACAAYRAQLATLEQLQRDYAYGAEWCSWGFVADVDPTGSPILAYPMQQSNVLGCSTDGPKVYTSVADSSTLASATCWGRKPTEVTPGVLSFNLNTWSLLGGRRNVAAPQTCRGLPRALNLTTWLPACDGMAVGGLCRGSCAPRFSGLPLATCGLSGVWMNVSGTCEQIPCDPGLGGFNCEPCPPNFYQKGKRVNCQPCPPGSYSPMGSSMCFDTRLAVGASHSCAVVGPKRQVVCNGKQGNGRLTPPDNLTDVTSVCTGFDHTCAVTNGRVVCWGDNRYNQTTPPADITDAVLVHCGELVSCVLTASRKVQCWGQVQIDTKGFQQVLGPVNISDAASSNVGQLSVGWHHVCTAVASPGLLGSGGKVYCFGYPNALELFPADASTTDILAAFWAVIVTNIRGVNINISGFRNAIGALPTPAKGAVEITGGNGFALARMKSGALALWGTGAAALNVPSSINVSAVATYDSHLCVRLLNDTIQCYGLDQDLQHLRETFAVTTGAAFNNITGYPDSKAATAACAAVGAKLATLQQLQRDYSVGADWCDWGYTADVDAAKKPILAYPAQTAGVPGCSDSGAMLYNTTAAPSDAAVMAVCYGKKPAVPTAGMLPFNSNTWSLFVSPSTSPL